MFLRFNFKQLTVLAATALAIHTAQADQLLKVEDGQGGSTSFLLADKPVVTMEYDCMVLTTDRVRVEYPLSDYVSWSVTGEASALENVAAEEPAWQLGETLSARGLQPNQSVAVYDLRGQLIAQGQADGEGSLQMDLSQGSKWLIVKYGNKSFKMRNLR